MTPCPVKKGSLVLIHGYVVHSSEANTSSISRHAYTYHILETDNVHYSEQNWLQYPDGESFPLLAKEWSYWTSHGQLKHSML